MNLTPFILIYQDVISSLLKTTNNTLTRLDIPFTIVTMQRGKNGLLLVLWCFVFCLGVLYHPTSIKSSSISLQPTALATTLPTSTPNPTLQPTPFPTPTQIFLKGFYTYQDPLNLFFITLPDYAKKLPGERPTVFQLQEGETLLIFQKEYLIPPGPKDLEELAHGMMFVQVIQENLAQEYQLLRSYKQNDFYHITAAYTQASQKIGEVQFAFKVSGTSLLGIMFISPQLSSAAKTWETLFSSFTFVRTISTTLPATSELETITTKGGEIITLPDDLRGTFQVPNGFYYQMEDYDYSLAQLGSFKAVGSGHFPQHFSIRSQISWWTAKGGVNWKETGCGYIFRYLDKKNYYVIFWSLDGTVYLKRVNKGQEVPVYDAPYSTQRLSHGEATISLIVSDNQVIAFYNDKRVFRMVDSPLSGVMKDGEVGLVLFSGTNLDFGTRCQFSQTELWEVKQP